MTAIQKQFRKDTATNLNAAIPANGEPGWDVTNKRLVVGDGATPGGVRHASAKDVQNNSFTYGVVGGTANAITLTHSPAVLSYVTGQEFTFKATNTNTAATKVTVDALVDKNVYRLTNGSLVALVGGEIVTGGIYTIAFDGTQFQLKSATGGGVAIHQQIFTASGTYTPTAGMLYCTIEAVGGGGNGHGVASGVAPGGGGGEYVRSIKTASDIGGSKTVTIGAGGTGDDTSLGSLVIAKGGANGSIGGAGGTGGTGDFKIPGQKGGAGSATTSGVSSGAGGASFFGHGGVGVPIGTGNAGAGYGAGGSGGGTFGSPNNNGGLGTSGVIIITEYCSS